MGAADTGDFSRRFVAVGIGCFFGAGFAAGLRFAAADLARLRAAVAEDALAGLAAARRREREDFVDFTMTDPEQSARAKRRPPRNAVRIGLPMARHWTFSYRKIHSAMPEPRTF